MEKYHGVMVRPPVGRSVVVSDQGITSYEGSTICEAQSSRQMHMGKNGQNPKDLYQEKTYSPSQNIVTAHWFGLFWFIGV